MALILLIDDHPLERMEAIDLLRNAGYRIRTLTKIDMADPMIETIKPALVLINCQPSDFDSVRLFMHIREKYPSIPALHFALKSDTAVQSLQQAIQMALEEAEAVARRGKLPELRRLTTIQSYEGGGALLNPEVPPAGFK